MVLCCRRSGPNRRLLRNGGPTRLLNRTPQRNGTKRITAMERSVYQARWLLMPVFGAAVGFFALALWV